MSAGWWMSASLLFFALLSARVAQAQACVPTGPEVCEGSNPLAQVDNDCDGSVNTNGGQYLPPSTAGSSTFYEDEDGDTYGTPGPGVGLCARSAEAEPQHWARNTDDCDDTSAEISPAAAELCNAIDNDCDGVVDQPTPWAEELPPGCVPYFLDQDQDGFSTNDPEGYQICVCNAYASDPANKPATCNPGIDPPTNVEFGGNSTDPMCWSYDNTDCADHAYNVSPWASEHIDGIDNDCDGRLLAVELDCDNDGSYALLPNESARDTPFPTATSLGLASCNGAASLALSCLGATISLTCDEASGLWMADTGFLTDLGVFANGVRVGQYTGLCDGSDCDDTCPNRCSGMAEACDGVDNDCQGVVDASAASDLPSAMRPLTVPLGTVSAVETLLDPYGDLYECSPLADPQEAVALSTCAALTTVPVPIARDSGDDSDDIAGCGCATTATPGWLAFGLVTLLLAGRAAARERLRPV